MHCRVHYSFDFDLKIRSGQVWSLRLSAIVTFKHWNKATSNYLRTNESPQYADKCIQWNVKKSMVRKKPTANLGIWIAVPPSQSPMFFDPGYFPQYFSFYTMLTYSRFFRVYDNQHVRPEVSKMADNSKRNISDPKTTRLLKFFKYRNIESTEIILNGFPRKDRGYLIEGKMNMYTVIWCSE